MEGITPTSSEEVADPRAIPSVQSFRKAFEKLREEFLFLKYPKHDEKWAHAWRLRGLSPLNLDVHVVLTFPQVYRALLVGSNVDSLNDYLNNYDRVIKPPLNPTGKDELTPRWEVRVGDECVMYTFDGDMTPENVSRAIKRLMSTQATDEDVKDQTTELDRPYTKTFKLDREATIEMQYNEDMMDDNDDNNDDYMWL